MDQNNRSFYQKAQKEKITVGDVFGDVFRTHTKEENARVLSGGTPLSTPNESDMLNHWQRPYLFARFFAIGLVVLLLGLVLVYVVGSAMSAPFVYVVGSLLVPMTAVLFMWEMNIPRNISFLSVIAIFVIGGMLSILFVSLLYPYYGNFESTNLALFFICVGLAEEAVKVLAGLFWVYKPDRKYILTGMLVGAAVGAGFASIESCGYAIYVHSYDITTLVVRLLFAIGGHVTWAALTIGALVWVKGSDKLRLKHFGSPTFLGFFVLVALIHFLWDFSGSLLCDALLLVAVLVIAFFMIRKGLHQVVSSVLLLNQNRMTYALQDEPVYRGAAKAPTNPARAVASEYRLQGLSGTLAGRRFQLTNQMRIGRDPNKNDLVFPASAGGISKTHCVIIVSSGRVYIKDLNSSYGTFVNGARLAPQRAYELQVGARISLGSDREVLRLDVKNPVPTR